MRTKNLINYPHLNSSHGDITKKWYVEFSFRLPGRDDKYSFRVYDGLCSGTYEERMQAADRLILEINEYLKSGEYLEHPDNYRPVRAHDDYRPEAERVKKEEQRVDVGRLIEKFLAHGRSGWGHKTLQDYRSKLKQFRLWTETTSFHILDADRKAVLPFFYWYVETAGVSRATVKKSAQVVRIFFDYLEETGMRPEGSNPVKNVPRLGTIVNEASVPFSKDERAKLRAVISRREPWLWLACELQYYCAIRPGTELRLARVRDIDREHNTITIPCDTAKARRTDIIGVPADVMEYMDQLGLFNWPGDYYIFGRYGVPDRKSVV